jgi:hypothetical protein
MITSLLLAFALQSPQSVTDIQARIPQTPFVVSLELSGWKENPSPGELLGNKLLLAGTISPAGSVLTLLVEANQPPKSPQYWRDRFAVPGLPFDVDFTPCVDSTVELAQGLVQSDFHAYFATRKHVLDLHISRMSEKQEAFPRAEFERIVKSLRVLLLRRGWAEDYPDSIGAPMTFASVLGVDQKGWKEGYLARHAEEWSAQFANAEFLHYSNAPFEEQLAACAGAIGGRHEPLPLRISGRSALSLHRGAGAPLPGANLRATTGSYRHARGSAEVTARSAGQTRAGGDQRVRA